MSLFDDHSDQAVRRAVTLVEQTIEALGFRPEACRGEERVGETVYALFRGSARIHISVRAGDAEQPEGMLRVWAGVVKLPAAEWRLPLFEHLLRLNGTGLAGAAFGVEDEEVILACERSVRDLDASEVDAMIRTVGIEADRYDDLLAGEFGLVRASDKRP